MKLIFATANRHKLQEVQILMPEGIILSTPSDHGITEDIPETAPTLEGNASQKAWYVYRKTGLNCFADDTGLEVTALNGQPGVHSARYAPGSGHDSKANMALLLKNLAPYSDRSAQFRTVISLIIDGQEYQFEGAVQGRITDHESGSEGFGYDPIFVADGFERSFAELTLEEKNSISHRARATRKLVEWLSTARRQ